MAASVGAITEHAAATNSDCPCINKITFTTHSTGLGPLHSFGVFVLHEKSSHKKVWRLVPSASASGLMKSRPLRS